MPAVIRDGKQVGEVIQVWVDGHLVRWEGHLPPPVFTWTDTPGDMVPLVAPPLPYLVARGWLVGLTDLVQGQMTTSPPVTVLSDWAVAGVTLLPYEARPWPELFLSPALLCERSPHSTSRL
ncbi:hypothetical protein [Streptomyces brevispora]|uniref:hypothetical protein n=1 Tax=Streptomyces brevispora TaxID=887462 RepID=UPI0037F62D88